MQDFFSENLFLCFVQRFCAINIFEALRVLSDQRALAEVRYVLLKTFLLDKGLNISHELIARNTL